MPNLTTAPTPKSPQRRRWIVIALTTVGVLALGLAIGVRVASGMVRDRVTALAERYGLSLEIGEVDLPLFSGASLRDVRVFSLVGGARRELGVLTSIQTDVSFVDALGGARRPSRVEVVGGQLLARWDNGPADVRRPPQGEGPAGEAEPIALALREVDVRLEARHDTPLGPIALAPLQLKGIALEAKRGADRALSARGSGRLDSAGRLVDLGFTVDLASGQLTLELGEGAELIADTPTGQLVATARTLHVGATLTATQAALALGDLRLGASRVGLHPAAPSVLTALATLREPADWATLEVEGLRIEKGPLGEAGDVMRLARAERLTVALRGGEAVRPTSVIAEGTGIRWLAPAQGLEVNAETGRVDLALASELPLEALLTEPLSAVKRLEVSKPALDIRLLKAHADTAAAPARATEAQVDEEDPPPMLGNDEELPPVERVVPALAPGSDWLAALLGSEDAGRSGTLLDLLPAELRQRLPALLPQLAALAPRVNGATLTVRAADGTPMLSLDDADFSARPAAPGTTLSARAAVYRQDRDERSEAARVNFEVTLADDLTIEALSGRISGRSIANQIARFSKALSVQDDAEVDLTLTYTRPRSDEAPHHVEGEISLRNFSFEFWRIADREIKDLQAKATFDASIDRTNHRLLLTLPHIEVGESHFAATLDLKRKANKLPRFTARLEMPRQDCGAAGRSIPKGLIPNLSTLELVGQMEFTMTLDLDLASPRELTLRVTGDTQACRARSLGPGIDPSALRGRTYVHRPREPKRGVLEHIRVGPGTPEWVPMEKIPPIVLAAAWITEDRRFREHGGVRWDLVQTALKMDLDHGRFIYGGSTVTQQLVKNLYLTRDKNLARKLEEMIIAWHMERVLSKDEILTLYVNCIEYGPDIYGIRHAARAYFNKKVADLDALETAFIMGLKPYPKAGYAQFVKRKFDPWWVRRVSHVLRLIAKYEPTLLSLEEAEAFEPYAPKFRDTPTGAP